MEQRAFLAVVLMAAVLILYQAFLVPAPEVVPPAPKPQEQVAKEGGSPQSQPTGAAPSPAPAAPLPVPSAPSEAKVPQRITKVVTPLYDAGVSSDGGKLQEFVLRYRGEKPMVAVGDLGPTGIVIAKEGSAQVLPMELSKDSIKLGPEQPSQDLVLTGGLDGLRVRQTQTFKSDTYTIDSRIRIENTGTAPRSVTVALPWSTR